MDRSYNGWIPGLCASMMTHPNAAGSGSPSLNLGGRFDEKQKNKGGNSPIVHNLLSKTKAKVSNNNRGISSNQIVSQQLTIPSP